MQIPLNAIERKAAEERLALATRKLCDLRLTPEPADPLERTHLLGSIQHWIERRNHLKNLLGIEDEK